MTETKNIERKTEAVVLKRDGQEVQNKYLLKVDECDNENQCQLIPITHSDVFQIRYIFHWGSTEFISIPPPYATYNTVFQTQYQIAPGKLYTEIYVESTPLDEKTINNPKFVSHENLLENWWRQSIFELVEIRKVPINFDNS